MPIRKSVRDLTDIEKVAFVDAILALKAEAGTSMPGVTSYDTYVVRHVQAMGNPRPWVGDDPTDPTPTSRNSAHRGPAFLPWHREFLRRLEADLQRVSGDATMGIPYWDWELDATFPDFFGGDGTRLQVRREEPVAYFFPVTEGPFRIDSGWNVVDGAGAPAGPLQRTFGIAEMMQRDPVSRLPLFDPVTGDPLMTRVTLPSAQDVQHVLGISEYDARPWDEDGRLDSFRNVLEGWWRGPRLHNQVHVWVDASMGPGTSPNDPTFFLHHCNIDRIWAEWQSKYPASEYLPQSGGPPGHNLNDPMFPWDGVATPDSVAPRDVLSLGNVTYAAPPP